MLTAAPDTEKKKKKKAVTIKTTFWGGRGYEVLVNLIH